MERDLFEPVHEEFRASVRSFVEHWLLPRRAEFVAQGRIDRDTWRAAGALGLLGLNIPGSLGGSATGDPRFAVVALEELAATSHAFSSAFGMTFDVVAPYLVELGTDEQRTRWLPGIASGERICALAMTEPGGGSDLAALRTRAVRDGDDFVLSGSKAFITNGASADLVLVAARTSGERSKGITLFAVETATPGFTASAPLDTVGQRESDTADLAFDDVRVPASHVVGDLDGGFGHLMSQLGRERLDSAVANVAQARAVLDATLLHARVRTAFGSSIGSLQHNKFRLAELVTRLDSAQALVDNAVRSLMAGRLDPVDAAKAKWWSAEVENEVLDDCVQLHGGAGWMRDSPVAQAWMDGRVTKIWAGSNEIMKEIIGRDLGL